MNDKILTLIAGSVLGAAVASTGFLVSTNTNTTQKNNVMTNPPQMVQGQMSNQNGGIPNMNNNQSQTNNTNGNNNSQLEQDMNMPNMNNNGGPQMSSSSNKTEGRPSIGKGNMGTPKGGMTPPSMGNMNKMPNINSNNNFQMKQNMNNNVGVEIRSCTMGSMI